MTSAVEPAIDATVFPNTMSNLFWTTTTVANGYSEGWQVNFNSSHVSINPNYYPGYVRCVR
jgi:hypothetical protein